MEPILETVQLDADESNELLFKVKVEGAEQAATKVRLVLESDDLSFMVTGHTTGQDGIVQFVVPGQRMKEGTYPASVEVIVDNRCFVPVKFNAEVKKRLSVVAEAVSLPVAKKRQETTVTVVPVKVEKPKALPEAKKQPTLRERHAAKGEEMIRTLAREVARSK